LSPEEEQRRKDGVRSREQGWGGVARKGAVNLRSEGEEMVASKTKSQRPVPLAAWVPDERPTASKTPSTTGAPRQRYALPGDVQAEVRKAFEGTAYQREKMVNFLTRAAEAYDRHRYEEALRLAKAVADTTPGVAPVRELAGLAAYRAERWAMARIHLKAYFALTGNAEHHPLVMDCERANHKYRAVEKTYNEVVESEPNADVLAEARIVYAGSLADEGKFVEAIELLNKAGGAKLLRNPSYRHVRLWYALGDVYDRAGETTTAREMFARVVASDPEAYDAAERLGDLGTMAVRKNRKRRTVPVSKKKLVD
jgi:tetratricopeptide (TPR) repeat protein